MQFRPCQFRQTSVFDDHVFFVVFVVGDRALIDEKLDWEILVKLFSPFHTRIHSVPDEQICCVNFCLVPFTFVELYSKSLVPIDEFLNI